MQASLNIFKSGEERLTHKTFNCDKRLALLPPHSHSLFSPTGFLEKVKASRHLQLFLDVPVHGTVWRRTRLLRWAVKAWLWKSLRELPSVQLFCLFFSFGYFKKEILVCLHQHSSKFHFFITVCFYCGGRKWRHFREILKFRLYALQIPKRLGLDLNFETVTGKVSFVALITRTSTLQRHFKNQNFDFKLKGTLRNDSTHSHCLICFMYLSSAGMTVISESRSHYQILFIHGHILKKKKGNCSRTFFCTDFLVVKFKLGVV